MAELDCPGALMRIFGFAMLLFFSVSSAVDAAEPATGATSTPGADPAMGQLLDKLEYKYDVDEEGDYRLTFALDEEEDGRSQLVFVRSAIETYGSHKVRESGRPATSPRRMNSRSRSPTVCSRRPRKASWAHGQNRAVTRSSW